MFIKNNFTLAMYTFSFGDGSLVKTSSTILECKNFKTQTHCAPFGPSFLYFKIYENSNKVDIILIF